MATNEIQGDLVSLSLSTDGGTTYKTVVCAENTGLQGTRNTNKKTTKCGLIKGFGPVDWVLNATGVFNSVPGTGNMSNAEIMAAFQGETPVMAKMQHASDSIYTRTGSGQITKLNETSNTGDVVTFDFSVEISGPLTLT